RVAALEDRIRRCLAEHHHLRRATLFRREEVPTVHELAAAVVGPEVPSTSYLDARDDRRFAPQLHRRANRGGHRLDGWKRRDESGLGRRDRRLPFPWGPLRAVVDEPDLRLVETLDHEVVGSKRAQLVGHDTAY